MRALFTEEEILIGETAGRLTKGGRARARRALGGEGLANEPTASLKADWLGLGISDDIGGSGGSLVGAALLLQELGRSLEPTSFSSEFIARHALATAGISVSVLGGRNLAVELSETIRIEGGRAMGTIAAVPGASVGCAILCAGPDGEVLVVEAQRAEPLLGVDPLRPSARVAIDGVPLARAPDVAKARAIGAVLVAAELCGAGRGALDLAVEYARDRVQFGRPIGSFQAIAHRLAEVSANIEAAWSLVLYACSTMETGAGDVERSAHAAKASAGEASLFAADACIQTHGGMGITHDADPHLYLRRALFCDAWFGPSPVHRQALGRLLTAMN